MLKPQGPMFILLNCSESMMLLVANKHSFGNYYATWLSNAIHHLLFAPCLSIWNTHKIIMWCYSLRPPETSHLSIKSKSLSGPSTPYTIHFQLFSLHCLVDSLYFHHANFCFCLHSIQDNYMVRTFSAHCSCHSLPPGLNKDVFFSIFKFNSKITSSGSPPGFSASPYWFAHSLISFF